MTPVYFVVIFPASSFLPGYGYDAGGVLGCRHAITRWSTNSRSGWEGYVAGARHLEIPPLAMFENWDCLQHSIPTNSVKSGISTFSRRDLLKPRKSPLKYGTGDNPVDCVHKGHFYPLVHVF